MMYNFKIIQLKKRIKLHNIFKIHTGINNFRYKKENNKHFIEIVIFKKNT